MRRKFQNIGGGVRFRILGGGGGKGGQIPSRHVTSSRRTDVASTSCARKVFNKSVPSNYIFHLKTDIIENSRIELRGQIDR